MEIGGRSTQSQNEQNKCCIKKEQAQSEVSVYPSGSVGPFGWLFFEPRNWLNLNQKSDCIPSIKAPILK